MTTTRSNEDLAAGAVQLADWFTDIVRLWSSLYCVW